LGQHFDIHGGGLDLQFPHHQNEIAQSEAANDCLFVNYWIHVGYVTIDKEKMSKSLGNFFTIKEVLQKYDAEIIRYFMIASHYRSPINYSQENLQSAQNALERFYSALRDLPHDDQEMDHLKFEERYVEAMEDDFNTPVALAVLFELVRDINRLRDNQQIQSAAQLGNLLKRLAGTLGFGQKNPDEYLKGSMSKEEISRIESLIAQRNVARQSKDWKTADMLRDELQRLGITIEDGAQGTTWKKEISQITENFH
jgi:cysteinyl-tRNA synthetase